MISFSVIVNTHNRAALLADCLRGLAGLHYPRFEVVVVNGPSTDGTEAVLSQWEGKIKLVRCPEANLALSRNLGIAAAAGEVVAFIDDDAVPHPNWLAELSYAYADPRVAGVGGFTLDHTGVRFQARKVVCDRFGNAFDRPDDFDERVLNGPGSELYPSLLGTNSSFRVSAVRAVGGFDPVFAYFLDETDLCLRLIDAGDRVVYAPEALAFHGFAPSAVRDERRVPRSIYQLAVSKAYFIIRHGVAASMEEAGRQLVAYDGKMRADNARLLRDLAIDLAFKLRLDDELTRGLADGRAAAAQPVIARDLGEREVAWLPFGFARPRSLAVLAREPGRELEDLLEAIVAQGWVIHLIQEAEIASCGFHAGIWRHRIAGIAGAGDALAVRHDIPRDVADWCAAVARKLDEIRGFGIDRVASGVRELPGLGVLDQVDFLLADGSTRAEFEAHPEWKDRVLFSHFYGAKLRACEEAAMAAIPVACDAAAALAMLGDV